jgi:hypothetical protein
MLIADATYLLDESLKYIKVGGRRRGQGADKGKGRTTGMDAQGGYAGQWAHRRGVDPSNH